MGSKQDTIIIGDVHKKVKGHLVFNKRARHSQWVMCIKR